MIQFNGIQTGLEGAKENLTHTANGLEITLRRNSALGLSTLDDPVTNATDALWSKTMSNSLWQRVGVEQSLPLSDFANRLPTYPRSFLPANVIAGMRPLRPGDPPPPMPSTADGVDRSIFEEPQLGIVNGLKTGLKALVNATVNTGAGLISLGQWDPADVWKVDPLNDVGYEGALIAARIGTAVASAALTGGLANGVGKLGHFARAVDRLDAVGNVIVGCPGRHQHGRQRRQCSKRPPTRRRHSRCRTTQRRSASSEN